MSGTIQKASETAVTKRYEALLRVSQTLISIRSSEELFKILARELRAVVSFYVMGVGIYDEKAHEVRLMSYGEPGVPLQVPKLAPEETFTWWVYQHQEPLIIPSLDAETRFPAVAEMLKNRGVRSVCALPLTTVHRRLGGLAVGSIEADAYSKEEVSFLSLVANQVALAVDDALNFDASQHAQEALHASKESFRLIVDCIPAFAWYAGPDGKLEYLNQRILDYTAERLEDLVGFGWARVLHSQDVERTQKAWLHSIETGEPCEVDQRVRRFDNIYRWFRTTAQPLRDHSGRVIRWYGVAHDIEDWKRAEEGLRERELNLGLVVDSIPGLVNTMTAEGENEFVNQQVLDYFGKSHEQLKNWSTSGAVHPDDLPRVIAAFTSSIETGQPYDTQHRIRRADGVYRWFQVRALPLRNTEGRIIRWYVLSTDIDERKQAQDRLQLLLDVTNQVVSNLQLHDLLRAISSSIRRVMHCDLVSVCFPDSELSRLQTFVLDFPESKGFIREEFFTSIEGSLSGFVFRTGKPWTGSALDILQLGLKDEAAIPEGLKTGCILPLVSRNRILGVLSLGRREENAFSQGDIQFLTQVAGQIAIAIENASAYRQVEQARAALEKALGEIKQRTEALRRSEGYLAEAQKLSHTGSFGWDVSSGEIYWSRETFRIFEYEPTAKVTPELVVQRTHPEDRSAVQQLMERVSRERTEFDFEHRLLMPDGSVKYLRVVGSPSQKENGCFEFVGAVTDITERKRADDALRRSEGCLAEAQRLTRTGSWAWNLAARHSVYWSQEHYRVFGFDPEEGIPSDEAFHQRIHPEDRDRVRRAVFAGREDEGSVFDVDYRIVLPGGAIKYIRSTGHPVLNASGDIIEYLGAARDMTEQHEARAALETAFEQIKTLKDQLYNENIALREEIDRSSMFEEIVGASPALRAVLSRVSKVAPTDSTVLLTGETGTGKELIARAIHKRSRRSSRAFVSVNCAAIPSSLIASELFGHEKGAFTGATQRRLGRFELAEEGTLFLDEVGELPAETQIALLRVLQEREFERVGGNQPIRVNVRVVAATNRDLEAAIAAGTFRSDLFYRLNVFPIGIPPLRERREDIHLLVEYFIGHFARKAGKSFRGINKKTLDLLLSYPWPGNVRELQNVVERSVIVCETEYFSVDESWLSPQPLASEPKSQLELSQKLAAQEKEMIEAALRESGGRVSGPSGAAVKLGIHRSTLESKIASLKINKYRFKTASASKNS